MGRIPNEIAPRVVSGGFFGIHNGHGGFWTDKVFPSHAEAVAHAEKFWGIGKMPKEHQIVLVRLVIEHDPAGGADQ